MTVTLTVNTSSSFKILKIYLYEYSTESDAVTWLYCCNLLLNISVAKRKKFVPVPVEASGSLEVGVMAVVMLSVIIFGIMLLDLRTIWNDLKGLKKNLVHFKVNVSEKIAGTLNLAYFGKYTPRAWSNILLSTSRQGNCFVVRGTGLSFKIIPDNCSSWTALLS